MLNRFRRSPGLPKTTSPSNNNKGKKSTAARRHNTNNSGNSTSNTAEDTLHELREKLDRLELLTRKIEMDVTSLVAVELQRKRIGEAGGTNENNNDSGDVDKSKGDHQLSAAANDDSNDAGGNTNKLVRPAHNDDDTSKTNDNKTSKKATTAATLPSSSTTTAKYAPISKSDENEMIELLRRIAELVVLSERRAGQILNEVAANNNNNNTARDEKESEKDESSTATTTMLDEDAALPYLAPFELFCERNILANIVNIVTGVAFAATSLASGVGGNSSSSSSSDQVGQEQTQQQQYLPPLTIATQAIQSVSILIQNVSRATSLYLLLSNNRVNDLIRLPLDLYKLAEWDGLRRGNRQQQQQQQRVNLMTFTSPEIGELTTHFVSFLKSLAMRVNAETLQFFLSFPMSIVVGGGGAAATASASKPSSDGGDGNKVHHEKEGGDEKGDGVGSVDNETIDEESVAVAEEVNTPPQPPIYTEHRQPSSYMEQRQNVDFPLYSRALEFCSTEQDSFVRVTAMNVCMNIIRLATVEQSSGDSDNNDDESAHSNEVPTGELHSAITLPLQDRIAIAQYACHPRRVSDLISPLCSRLTSQFGQVEGAVRALEELNNATIADNENIRSKANRSTTPQRNTAKKRDETRDRLIDHIRDLIANVQDELLLLDDLLEVGLISLNEQAIEMMLATFVYPMLLQPLLLPLHRFSSSKNGSASTAETPKKKARKQTISLQSPPPFSPKPTDGVSSKFEKEATISNDAESDGISTNTSNGKDLHSSDEMDLAPSKTALFGLSVIFHAVSNATFCHLLLTALLHPLSPEASGGLVIICPPQITLPVEAEEGNVAVAPDDVQIEIRMEENQTRLSKRNEGFQQIVPVYNFGTKPESVSEVKEEKESNNDDATNTCIFILAPALVDMLRNHTGLAISDKASNFTGGKSSSTRPNPYRNILISAIKGSEEMVSLQSLAVAAVQSALLSVDKSVFKRILFASKQIDESSDIDECVVETVRSLCQSVVNKSVTYDGWWKVKFNAAAARTLMDIVSSDFDSLRFVNDIMTDIREEAAEYLMTLPSQIDAKSRQGDSPNNSSHSKEHLDSWLLDRFYFDQPDKSTNSAVESVCYLKEEAKDGDSKVQYRYGLQVLSTISVMKSTDILCESSLVVENMLVSESSGNTPFHCAASWAVACLYLDAFCIKIAKLKASFEDKSENCLSPQRQLSYISASPSDDALESDLSMSLAHLSSKFAIAMLDEVESSETGKVDAPTHGSVVGLIGKAAFPCVCEVSSSFSYLFTGRSSVLSEGIQWQSLYLVVVGKWAVLAEPERGGTGGEGRVITSCRLSCLALRRDTSSQANNNSPARRLLVAHASLDPHLPALFSLDASSSRRSNSRRGPSLGPDGLRLTRSRMDLWFEDSNAAGHAYKVLSSKIAKARAKRGGNIKAALLAR
ncbi:protein CLEC16A [Skeletonema marinoi]|uniref:Protein CLEC16A n=1 Tax=Skeletonema marinoi TaxID=267567 RepID=A0AAD8Y2M0_9STRA|nr:protein CLEC16A [Skeletonema marinoi]